MTTTSYFKFALEEKGYVKLAGMVLEAVRKDY